MPPRSGPRGNGASPHTIHVLALDPFGPFAMLVPIVQTRIQAFASERVSELDPEIFTRGVMQRLYGGDRLQKVLIFWDEGQTKVVGHALAEICAQGRKAWVFVHQCMVDQAVNTGDAVQRAIELVDAWATEVGQQAQPPIPITLMTFSTHRDDAAWERRYGFTQERKIMVRAVGAPTPGDRKREPAEA